MENLYVTFYANVVEFLPYLLLFVALLLVLMFLQAISNRNQYLQYFDLRNDLMNDSAGKIILVLGKIILCFVIVVGLYEFYEFLYFTVKGTFIPFITIAIIVFSIASVYVLFVGYAKYITRKILNLYKKPDGEYIIISDSIWLFWLPIFWLELSKVVGLGIKAKKIRDCIELREVRKKEGSYGCLFQFRFDFCKKSNSNFSRFGCIEKVFDYRIIFAYHEDDHNGEAIWLLRLMPNYRYWDRAKEKGKKTFSEYRYDPIHYYGSNAFLHNHLMGIYFIEYTNEFGQIIYNIITQTGKNKVIQQEEIEGIMREYYYNYESGYSDFRFFRYIAKIITKEGYYYIIEFNTRLDFDIKEFVQQKCITKIYSEGLFTYGDKDNGALIYCCLNGNYFRCTWRMNNGTKSIKLEPITSEAYLELKEKYENNH